MLDFQPFLMVLLLLNHKKGFNLAMNGLAIPYLVGLDTKKLKIVPHSPKLEPF